MPAVVADDAFRLAGGAGGVQHIQRVGRGDRNRVDGCRSGHQFMPVEVAARGQLTRPLFALQDDAVRRRTCTRPRARRRASACSRGPCRLDAARGGHDDGGVRVVDARREFMRGEPAEHHRMHRAQPCAREHRDHRLGTIGM